MRKALILGARGNLGQQLTAVFNPDYETISWDRGEIDIADRDLIIKKIGGIKPEIIINAAAYNAVDKCEESDEEYDLAKRINIDGPKYLVEACLETGATLVHYSSNYVFDGRNESGYNEIDMPAPINRYGKTKFHGEKRILESSGRGLKWYLIRTSKLFGASGLSEMAKPSFFDIMLKKACEAGANDGKQVEPLKVVDDEISCFTYTPDLARATKELIEADKGYGIYHLVNSHACTWYQAVLELFKIADINVTVAPIPGNELVRQAKRPKYAALNNTKLAPLRDYREALREYLVK